MTTSLVLEGRAWVLGDAIAVDGDLMPLALAVSRETRPEVLRREIMAAIRPEFAADARPGDIVVAGRRFAQGNPHIQAFLGFAAHGVGLAVESIPRGSLRNAVNAAVPLLPRCPGLAALTVDGDRLQVDFRSGLVRNLSQGTEQRFEPLPRELLEIIEVGGWKPMVRRRIARQAQPC